MSLGQVMRQVGITAYTECHLDPDLYRPALPDRHANWRPAFGQAGNAETILANERVGEGDLFLFYGWFREIRFSENRYRYVRNAPDLHVIFGYLEVDEVIDLGNPLVAPADHLSRHPHVVFRQSYPAANRVYSGERAGVFHFHDSLVLTRRGETRSRWEMPSFFQHEPFKGAFTSFALANGNVGIDFTGRNNQELLISSTPEVIAWAETLIRSNRSQYCKWANKNIPLNLPPLGSSPVSVSFLPVHCLSVWS